ncbi:hypothetical protein BDM02DRAFT_3109562 [Thelephora ganbajun]|uniref:Uncharacterized protein n=1 Tax=Thelephora ganbajun TaxID=370292 RepID=A0ACB6ZQV4_THEGA|nr:hypothetical protein BDM02DRAFT_3109562 [Thelephora ganbajun]
MQSQGSPDEVSQQQWNVPNPYTISRIHQPDTRPRYEVHQLVGMGTPGSTYGLDYQGVASTIILPLPGFQPGYLALHDYHSQQTDTYSSHALCHSPEGYGQFLSPGFGGNVNPAFTDGYNNISTHSGDEWLECEDPGGFSSTASYQVSYLAPL